MNMVEAVKHVLGNYANFTGRAARPEFWWWVLALILLQIVTSIIDGALIAPMLGSESFDPDAGQPLSLLVALALLIPSIAVSVRRLHDLDRSGWWYLLGLVPIIGPLVLLFWYVQAGTAGDNRFGPAP
jgi:uncharacterized membrane protein YhaH (DUF805 family)